VSHKSEKRKIFLQSDVVFKDFNNKHGHNLNSNTLAYVNRYKHIAIEDMEEYKIPASITLAQGILESGSGKSHLALKSNNHFGIKCHKDWKGEKVKHDDDRRRECFRKYNHPEESFDDHSKFLTSRGRYAPLFKLREDDYKAWAKGLKKAGYATDRKYPKKLIVIIEDYQLYEYDHLVLTYHKKKRNRHKEYEVVDNSDKYIVVNKGDTLYSIARQNSVSVSDLKIINNLKTNEISIGQKLFLGK
ncbi:MAG: glucosaminidase domain-containing protein, partial [Flavobacteriaceae bacterium]|nr:glucosaminidase domain-containing protein [Flavobacteriaceae bacterium]